MSQSAPVHHDDALTRGLRRWRWLLLGSVSTIAALAVSDFAADRYTSRWAAHAGNVLRTATQAQRSVWESESATRTFLLAGDTSAPTRVRAEQDSVARLINRLHALTGDNPPQHQRIYDLSAALARWDSTFATPVFSGRPLTRSLALAGTVAFDEVSALLDDFIAVETALRIERLRAQQFVAWAALFITLVALGLFGAAAARLTRALQAEAASAHSRQLQIGEQSSELEKQARLLEAQAAQLEGQASELRERIVERDETNRLLRQTATFLDTALESAPFGIAFYDRGLRFQRINEALARINGAPAEAHLGRLLEDMIPALAPSVRPIFERVLASGIAETNVLIEGETPARPGDRRRWLVTYYPILRPGEPAGGVGCMVLDVTEQQRVEQQLRQAQRLEAVGRLAGGIAHDFNNVLTVIQSYAEVLAFEFDEQGRTSEEVNAIRAAADRATALARQLLAFSRRDVIIPRDVDINAVVLGLDLILRRLLTHGVRLTLDLSPQSVVVRMDSGQLEQVLMNLAINAADAMPDGGSLTITTALSAGERVPAQALLTVADTGHGMSAEVQERLFEPFFTTKPPGRGTGLGLATTYAIVTEAGGTIAVTSSTASGSRFDITLPASAAPVDKVLKQSSPAPGAITARGDEVILVAEDEPAILNALSRVLTASGYRVLEASNGGEALRIAAAEPGAIHLLLTDVMMPGIGGKELVERLRESRPTTRVILMSGYTDDAELRTALGNSAFVFLQKPFAARQVVAAVRDALDAPPASTVSKT